MRFLNAMGNIFLQRRFERGRDVRLGDSRCGTSCNTPRPMSEWSPGERFWRVRSVCDFKLSLSPPLTLGLEIVAPPPPHPPPPPPTPPTPPPPPAPPRPPPPPTHASQHNPRRPPRSPPPPQRPTPAQRSPNPRTQPAQSTPAEGRGEWKEPAAPRPSQTSFRYSPRTW